MGDFLNNLAISPNIFGHTDWRVHHSLSSVSLLVTKQEVATSAKSFDMACHALVATIEILEKVCLHEFCRNIWKKTL
jgi:hypothetical protein